MDPDWWSRGWRSHDVDQEAASAPGRCTDSVMILLTALGVERDFMSRARPDSLLAARLFMLQVEDSFKFDELKPYLTRHGPGPGLRGYHVPGGGYV